MQTPEPGPSAGRGGVEGFVMPDFSYDLRLAIRGLRRTPAFTGTAVLILALGIGMSVAMFTVFDRVLVRRLPVRDQDRIVVLWTHRGDPALEVSGNFKHLEEQLRPETRTLGAVAAVAHWGAVPTPFLEGDGSITLNRTLVTGNYFEVLGARPVIGRLLRQGDEVTGARLTMVISYRAWVTHFGGDPGVVGRTLRDAWGTASYTIVGVGPAGLDYPAGVEAWTPPWSPLLTAYVIARLAPNASAAAARDEYFNIEHRLLPEWNFVGATVTPFDRAVLGNVRPVLNALTLAVALLLVIACVNVGNLLLLRAASRRHEIAVRRALGASSGDIVRQLLIESVALGAAGGTLGLVWAQLLLRLLIALAPPTLPRLDTLRLAGTPLMAALVVTLIAVMFFGLFPALNAAGGSSLASSLRRDPRSGAESRGRRRLRQGLVACQVALALVLLAGAGLVARSLGRMLALDLGYTAGHLSILQLAWSAPKVERLIPLGEELLRRFRATPGVQAATPIMIPPFLGANVFHGQVVIEGQTKAEEERDPSVPLELGNADYFRTFDVPILRGRGILESDREDAPLVAVLSQSIARRLWPDENPIGKRIKYWSQDTWRTVVGVAGDIRFRSLREATPTIYLPWRQTPSWQLAFAVRTSASLGSVIGAIRREARAVDPGINVWDASPMDRYLAGPLTQPRLSAYLLSAFGMVALALAAIGLYGVMASTVRAQTREIGIRIALGATPALVRSQVHRRAMMVMAAGAGVGLAGALAGTGLLRALLFEVSPTDPAALAGACALLLGVGLAASYVPARRATRVDPVDALRSE
jgi:predicted permease